MTKWIQHVPFKGYNNSGSSNQNFLYQSDNIFVMDNHRAALWCWAQLADLSEPHQLLHIDRHYDTLTSQLDEWIQHLPDLKGSINDYLGAEYQLNNISSPVIRWDNYLSIHIEQFGDQLTDFISATHNEGDKPKYKNISEKMPWAIPDNLEYWLENNTDKWIVNIDLDYFFTTRNDTCIQMFSDEYIRSIFEIINKLNDTNKISVITLCLTPDYYTPGWKETEAMATKVLSILGKQFSLSP